LAFHYDQIVLGIVLELAGTLTWYPISSVTLRSCLFSRHHVSLGKGEGAMKSIIHRFMVLCGAALVILRLYPSSGKGWVSKLFFDDVIHAKIEAASMWAISFAGFSSDDYQAFVPNLMSLGHSFAILFQAVAIALTFYIITRWI
jgi:hypothetical protein